MKRILHIVGGMNQGGTENFIMNLYRNIDKNKIQFDFLVNRKGYFDDEILSMGGKIYYIPALQKIGYFRYIKKLDDFFNKHKSEYRIVHSHINQVSGLILERAKISNIPIRIAHSHNNNYAANIFVRIYKEFLGRKIGINATHLFACSNDASKFLFKNNSKSSYIIYNGVDYDKFKYSEKNRIEIRNKYKISNDCFVIGNIARFSAQKNHKFLIELFNQYVKNNPKSILLLIGEGKLEKKIKQEVNQLGLSKKVIFVGITGEANKYYSAFDSFVLPSHFEGLGIVLLETQICGLKCICSKEGIPNEAKISDNIVYMSLKDSYRNWIKEISKINDRKNVKVEKKFDIKFITKKLFEFYVNENNECLKGLKISEKN